MELSYSPDTYWKNHSKAPVAAFVNGVHLRDKKCSGWCRARLMSEAGGAHNLTSIHWVVGISISRSVLSCRNSSNACFTPGSRE